MTFATVKAAPLWSLWFLVFAFVLSGASCERREGGPSSTTKAPAGSSSSRQPDPRLQQLRANFDQFQVRVSLHRQSRYPAAVVELGVGSVLPGSARNVLRVPISREDAERITDAFEQEGFFRRNEMSTYI